MVGQGGVEGGDDEIDEGGCEQGNTLSNSADEGSSEVGGIGGEMVGGESSFVCSDGFGGGGGEGEDIGKCSVCIEGGAGGEVLTVMEEATAAAAR